MVCLALELVGSWVVLGFSVLMHYTWIFYQLSYQGTPKYTCELYKKVVNDLDNRDVLGTHLDPDNCTHLTC